MLFMTTLSYSSTAAPSVQRTPKVPTGTDTLVGYDRFLISRVLMRGFVAKTTNRHNNAEALSSSIMGPTLGHKSILAAERSGTLSARGLTFQLLWRGALPTSPRVLRVLGQTKSQLCQQRKALHKVLMRSSGTDAIAVTSQRAISKPWTASGRIFGAVG